jgi:hypothetical protein
LKKGIQTLETKQTIQEYLDSLPKSEEGLLSFLKEKGMKGLPIDPGCCPLARLFRIQGYTVLVDPDTILDMNDYNNPQLYKLSEGQGSFVVNFDCKKYPELIG